MTRCRVIAPGLLAGLLVTLMVQAAAAEELLQRIPDSCLGFVLIHRLGETEAAVQRWERDCRTVLPPAPMLTKILATGRDQIDYQGSAALVAMPGDRPEAPPCLLLFLPVANYSALIAALRGEDPAATIVKLTLNQKESLLVRRLGDYAVFADPTSRTVLEQLGDSASKTAQTFLDWQEWFRDNNVVAVIKSSSFKPLVQGLRSLFLHAGQQQGEVLAALAFFGPALESLQPELSAAAIAMRFDRQDALLVSARVSLSPGSKLAKLLPPGHLSKNLLASLPDVPFEFVIVGAFGPHYDLSSLSIAGILLDGSTGFAAGNSARQIASHMRDVAILRTPIRPGDTNIASRTAFVTRTDSPQKLLNSYEDFAKDVGNLLGQKTNAKTVWTVLREDFDGCPSLRISMDAYIEEAARKLGKTKEDVLAHLTGQGKEASLWLVTADNQTVVSGSFRRDLLRQTLGVIRKSEKSLAQNSQLAKLAPLSYDKASWIGYWRPGGFLAAMKAAVPDLKAPDFPSDQPIGFALETLATEWRGYLTIPNEVLQATVEFVPKFLKARQERIRASAAPAGGKDDTERSSLPAVRPKGVRDKPSHTEEIKVGSSEAVDSAGEDTDEEAIRKKTARAMAAALYWLSRHQSPDGSWSFRSWPQQCKQPSCSDPGTWDDDRAATSLAMLCFVGAGQSHRSKGPYQAAMAKSVAWLTAHQARQPNGEDRKAATGECLAAVALVQAFAISQDPALRESAQAAIRRIDADTLPAAIGWHYAPGQPEDTSYLAWRLMALAGARSAGLAVDAAKFQPLVEVFQKAAMPITPDTAGGESVAVAAAWLAESRLQASPQQRRLADLASQLTSRRSQATSQDAFGTFFAAQVLYQTHNDSTKAWQRALEARLRRTQCLKGCSLGSWAPQEKPSPDGWAQPGGRLMTTCLSLLALEVYYRYLPMWKSARTKP